MYTLLSVTPKTMQRQSYPKSTLSGQGGCISPCQTLAMYLSLPNAGNVLS